MDTRLRIVHYLNQLFGGIGGEDKADVGPVLRGGLVGPGKAIEVAMKGRGEIVATVICGDNYFVENLEGAVKEVIDLIIPYKPDVVFAGPAFNAGRYGVACGEVCKVVQGQLSIPAVTGMFEENPGVDLYKKEVYILSTKDTAIGMAKATEVMVNLAYKLVAKEKIEQTIGKRVILPVAFRRPRRWREIAAERTIDMLLAKLKDEPFESEVIPPQFGRIEPAPPVKDLSKATIALITDGGLIPEGNPDKLEARRAHQVWFIQYRRNGPFKRGKVPGSSLRL